MFGVDGGADQCGVESESFIDIHKLWNAFDIKHLLSGIILHSLRNPLNVGTLTIIN